MARGTPSERWNEVDRVLDGALDLPPAERAAFVERACGTDAELRAEVERILRAQAEAGDFLEEPLADLWSALAPASTRSQSSLTAPGATLADRYVLEREIGRGGMATVYLARDMKHQRPVALKVLDPDLARSAGATRFLREIAITANLQHPHILPLHDSGAVPARHPERAPRSEQPALSGAKGGDGEGTSLLYYVMPFVAGESLRERLVRDHRLPVPEVIRLARDVAGALDYAHRRGVLHRDIKPGNILLEDGQAIVADFGIARAVTEAIGAAAVDQGLGATRPGVTLGTPLYMSPEQASGERELTPRSDVYSLGCVVYEMLAGAPPFTARTASAIIGKHLHEPAPPLGAHRPDVPPHVEHAVARALSKEPDDRFQSAGEFSAALSGTENVPAKPRWLRTLATHRVALGGVLLALIAVALSIVARRQQPVVAAPAAAIAVFPLVPAVRDTALTRLGRELVITLSASLEGVDGIRTVDALTVLASAHTTDDAPPLADAIALARRLGARSVVYGSVIRVGDSARIDVALQPTSGGEPLARVSVTAAPDDMAALTDSAAWGLLRQLWQRTNPPTPSLAAITTRSMPALRAFLNGERLVVSGRWRAASDAFQLATTLDSTFWLAYWRYAFTRDFYVLPVDSTVRTTYRAHRHEFPERDRLLIEAAMVDSASAYHTRVKAITERFPDYWPGWWALSEYLAHTGPLFGTRDSDLREALERTLALNPQMMSGLDHLMWVALWQRDTLLSGRLIRELTALRYDSIAREESSFDLLAYNRYLDALARSGGVLHDWSLAEPMLSTIPTITGPLDPHQFALGSSQYGFPQAQVALVRAMSGRSGLATRSGAWRLGLVIAQAERGDWELALATMDQFIATTPDPIWPLYRYRLAVVGAWLGTIDPDAAAAVRTPAVQALAQLQRASHAELAWLDGLLAVARNDPRALTTARRTLSGTDTITAPFLDRSLAAFALALGGRRSQAADSLAALERERAEFGWSRLRSDAHPFLTAVNRLAAARWLLERGDAAVADRLLAWHQAVLYPLRDTRQANIVVEPFAYLERARVAEALGRVAEARDYYERFLWLYDSPAASHRHLVEDARSSVVRLGQRPPGDRSR